MTDTRKSEGLDYDANLKNMWMVVINKQVIREGTDQQKEFFIKEQTDLDNNLAHFNNFYKLLLETKSITTEKKSQISKEFYVKNKKRLAKLSGKRLKKRRIKKQN